MFTSGADFRRSASEIWPPASTAAIDIPRILVVPKGEVKSGLLKKRTELDGPIVTAKKKVAVKWCANSSEHAASYGGKPWRYVLIPHDEIAENMTLDGLAARFGC